MKNKTIRRTLYRVFRKTGVPRNDIQMNASFKEDLRFDSVDWALFLFFLESSFNISVKDEEISQLNQVKDSLQLVENMA
ncbi:acyl carrier protein [Sunxiuqinia sp. A32]|uniref:acyl carrier protein n=1 Tax=Sunxiuqinia sp. A32 TaxID=3461496 RepID=UPI0040461A54